MKPNILYSFRRCPYAIRARWALMMIGKQVIIREVNLSSKPMSLMEISPKGTVPVLQTCRGEIIEESLNIMKWAINSNQEYNFIYNNIEDRFKRDIDDLIVKNDSQFKYHLDRYKYSNRYSNANREFHRSMAREILLELNVMLSYGDSMDNLWLVNGQESLADWSLWPFVRQYRIADPVYFEEDSQLSLLKSWLDYHLNHKYFYKLMLRFEPWSKGDPLSYFP